MSPQHCANGLAEARPKLPQSPPQQQPLPQSVSDEPAEQKPLDSASLQQRLGYRQPGGPIWTLQAQLEGLDSLTRTLRRTVVRPRVSRPLRLSLGDPAVNRNPRGSALTRRPNRLSRLLHSCMDSRRQPTPTATDDSCGGQRRQLGRACSRDFVRAAAEGAGGLVPQAGSAGHPLAVATWTAASAAYSDLCDRLSNKPWRFDPTSSASRCVRARPAAGWLAGGRRRVRLQPPRMSAASTAGGLVRCSCAPPLPGCALCGGWRNRVRPGEHAQRRSQSGRSSWTRLPPGAGPPAPIASTSRRPCRPSSGRSGPGSASSRSSRQARPPSSSSSTAPQGSLCRHPLTRCRRRARPPPALQRPGKSSSSSLTAASARIRRH
uniref:Uncharacterized protein n=1 Tax=Macrostomum lignano TaxID=282301 RepID=A0A1I8FQN7_9PLAT